MRLTIHPRYVPTAYIPLADVAGTLGVSTQQATNWCASGELPALWEGGRWWVTESDLRFFVERATWRIVSPAPIG